MKKISRFAIELFINCKRCFVLSYKFNTKLNIVDEAYTTKTCSNCNEINDIGSSKKYDCKKCDFTCDRDINASINIFKK